MSQYQRERERFIVKMSEHGMTLDTARLILRHARTLQRLSEAQCNGDYPADNGQRKTVECHVCGSHWAPESMAKDRTAPKIVGPGEHSAQWVPLICKDCRTAARVKAVLPDGWTAITQGDPRGYVLRIVVPGGQYSDSGRGDHGVYGVPS